MSDNRNLWNYNQHYEIKSTVIQGGIGLGSVLAVVVSWERNKSVLLAFLHGIFSWLYVLYFVITRKPEEIHKKQDYWGFSFKKPYNNPS